MKFNKTNKFKSLFLAGVLSLSLFFGGCSSTVSNLGTVNSSSTTQETNGNSTTSNSNLPEGAEEAIVERVVDGDTVKVKLNGSNETTTLRLLLMDTPESVKPGVDPQPYSIEASNYAKELLKEGDTVYLEYDDGAKTDKYNRHLCYLWYYDKDNNQWKMFNEKMVEEGLARVGYISSQKRHLDLLYTAQDKAKSNKLNIWSVDGYVTDKGYDEDAYYNGGGKQTTNTNQSTSSSSNNSDKNSTSSSSNSNKTNSNEIVYANGGSSSSNKYHSSRDAHGMKGAVKMTQSKAEKEGYIPCGLCYK